MSLNWGEDDVHCFLKKLLAFKKVSNADTPCLKKTGPPLHFQITAINKSGHLLIMFDDTNN